MTLGDGVLYEQNQATCWDFPDDYEDGFFCYSAESAYYDFSLSWHAALYYSYEDFVKDATHVDEPYSPSRMIGASEGADYSTPQECNEFDDSCNMVLGPGQEL